MSVAREMVQAMASSTQLLEEVARESPLLYDRDRHAGEEGLRVAIERIRQAARQQNNAHDRSGSTGFSGRRSGNPGGSPSKDTNKARNQNRDQSKRSDGPHQTSYLPPPPMDQRVQAAPPLSEMEEESHAPA